MYKNLIFLPSNFPTLMGDTKLTGNKRGQNCDQCRLVIRYCGGEIHHIEFWECCLFMCDLLVNHCISCYLVGRAASQICYGSRGPG